VKIYTKTGDDGLTGLLGSRRVSKDDARIEAYGTIDELNAAIGVARAQGLDAGIDQRLQVIQDELFVVGSALADPSPDGRFHSAVTIDHAIQVERAIDELQAELPTLTEFILPGGTLAAAQLHLARTICRRGERSVVRLRRQNGEHVPHALLVYLNRLSDFLFVLARAVNHRAGVAEARWSGL
jgi:cob(I)alamin adenosyltransferase